MKKVLLLVMVLCFGLAPMARAGDGQVLYKSWIGLSGIDATLANLINHADYPDNPTGTAFITVLGAEEATQDNWGGEITGYLIPPVTGDYTFWIASDDQGEFWLSPSADPADGVKICEVTGWCPRYDWDNTGNTAPGPYQQSAAQRLYGNRKYNIMVRWSDGTGGGYADIAWAGPADSGLATTAPVSSDSSQVVSAAYITTVPPNPGATDPIPAVGATTVPIDQDLVLSWQAPEQGTVEQYNIYLSADDALIGDPNITTALVGTVAGDGTLQVTVPAGTLANSTMYYWRVDSIIEPGTAMDPNNAYGDVWSFMSINMLPIITAEPADVAVGLNCAGVFTVEAISGELEDGGALTYQWKQAGGAVLTGETSSTLVTGTPGGYYCTVTNDNGSTDSAIAVLSIPPHTVPLSNMTVGDEAPVAGEGVTVDVNTGTYVVGGGGHDIWDDNDDFQFVYVALSGDGEISARVASFVYSGTDGQTWGKAGVMIRDTLDTLSTHATMAATIGQGPAWQARKTTDPVANGNQSLGGAFAPVWVRVVRQGNNFTGYRSDDGVNWTVMPGDNDEGDPIGSPQSITMTDPVYVGLAVTSHTSGTLATATFDNVKCEFGGVQGFGASWKAENPSPSAADWNPDTWVDPTQAVVLDWDPAPLGPCGATYNVVWSFDPDEAANPDATVDYVVTDTMATIPVGQLDYEQYVYWRVDVIYDGDKEVGDVWYMETVKLIPEITQQPVDLHGLPGDTVTFSITAATLPIKPITDYSWYKEGVAEALASGPTQSTFDVVVSDATAGMYYCVVTNESGPRTSESARLTVSRMVAHYPLDTIGITGEPNFVEDISGQGHHGRQVGGGVTVVPGMVGDGAFAFAGNYGDYVDCGTWNPSDGTGELSISHWVAWDGQGGSTWQGSIGKRDAWAANEMMWQLELSHNNKGFLEPKHAANDPGGAGFGHIMPPDLTWVHYVVTFNGSNTVIYINGQSIGSSGWTLGPDTQAAMVIGASEANGGNPWHGYMDDVRIYNYALSAAEAVALYAEVSGESICFQPVTYDLNGDCTMNLADFAIWAAAWMDSNLLSDQ